MSATKYGVKEISLRISVLLTVVNLLIIGLASYFFISIQITFALSIGLGLALFGLTYLIVYLFLERFIFRRIKLIYKMINSSKVEDGSDLTNKEFYKSNSLDEVDKRVASWAKDTADELETLKSLENYRRTYLGNISHELKTPLFSIQGYILTLLEGAMYDEEVSTKYLQKAAKNAERLSNIINDLDYISSLETDGPELNFRNFNILNLVISVIDEISLQAEAKKISITINSEELLDPIVYADNSAISQVLTNLLINSIKYGKEVGQTNVLLIEVDDTILIEVSDNGIGIEEKYHKHLFDRFFRVDKSRSREKAGSGLGLSIVKHIMEAHNQKITVRSTPGVGSTFGFTLQKASSVSEVESSPNHPR